jgi:hypothetical protein
MVGFDYGLMAKTTDRLMKRFKQGVVTLTRTTAGTPDSATPWEPVVDRVDIYTLDATASAITVDQATAKLIDGTTILASDIVITAGPKMTLVSTDGVPTVGAEIDMIISPLDVVAIDGAPVAVVKVMRVTPAGVALVWKFVVRG